ncbi:hypothetical protein Nepgr_010367 [Nepenthes gracilis]|uniref:RING-type E3 ubiquitin transferase n=1 Tax=Nepenthes gracilis TaxID=150966 RepID=A0AAD3SCH6_NEPGR|nr:hypothetical protein Nepgr_010367 [Nepenthes gracilis]
MDSMTNNYVHLLSPPPTQPSSIFHFPSQNSAGGTNFPVIIIAIIGILATAFLLFSYYVFVIKCCLNWHRIDLLRRFFSRRPGLDDPSVLYPPAVAVPSRGLEESVIRSIPTIRFRHEAKASERGQESYYECAVCLGEFKEGDKLRVIPNCCHAFHIDCIDVWLQTSANCPLCRSSISSSTLRAIDQTIAPIPAHLVPNTDNFRGSDEDYVVIELQGSCLDEPRLVRRQERLDSGHLSRNSITSSPWEGEQKLQQKLGDECIDIRGKDGHPRIQTIRRSISMDSLEDQQPSLQIQEILQQSTQVRAVSASEGCSSR